MTAAIVPRLEYRPGRPCVSIPVQATLQEWNRTIEQIPQLFQWLGQNGVTPDGALFYRYRILGDNESEFNVEIGMAVSEPVEGSGPVVAGEIPAGTYVASVHHGHPDRLFEVNAGIEAWASEQGVAFDLQRIGDQEVWTGRFEFFLTNPEDEPDPANWSTEVAILIADVHGAR